MGILVLLQPHQLIKDIIILTLQFNSITEIKAKVSFSNDGGTSWTIPIEVHPNIGINNATLINAVVNINIPSNICGSSDVKIRFIYDGTILYVLWILFLDD